MVKNLPANAGDMGSVPRMVEKEVATHSSFDPFLPGVAVHGVTRVGHDLATEQQRGEFTLYKCFLYVSHTHLCAYVYVCLYTYVCLYIMKCRHMAANED